MTENSLYTPDDLVFQDHIIECLLKGGASFETAYRVLVIYIKEALARARALNSDLLSSEPEELEIIREKILMKHEELLATDEYTQRRNIAQEVEDLLSFRGQTGARLSDIYNDLRLTTTAEKGATRVALNRLVARGVVEKTESGRTGYYRIIESDLQEVKFIEGENNEATKPFPLWLPLGLNDLCEIYAKNIIVVAGSKGAGKTALLFNIALANQHKIPIEYYNSEMGDVEYTMRMRNFGIKKAKEIAIKVYHRHDNYQDVINGAKKLYIIDFLECHDNFYEIGKPIRAIHEKLKDGVAIIALQMKQGQKLGRGGEFSMEKARLYLTLDYDEQLSQTQIRIADAKFPKVPYAVRGLHRNIKIIGGHRLSPVGDAWQR